MLPRQIRLVLSFTECRSAGATHTKKMLIWKAGFFETDTFLRTKLHDKCSRGRKAHSHAGSWCCFKHVITDFRGDLGTAYQPSYISRVHSHSWSLKWVFGPFLSPFKPLISFTLSWILASHYNGKTKAERTTSPASAPWTSTWNPPPRLYLHILFLLLYLWLRCHPSLPCTLDATSLLNYSRTILL